MRCLSVVLLGLVVVVAVVALGLGYMGFVPGVASVFGSDQPRDLAVKYTTADLQSANQKVRTKITALAAGAAPQDSLKISGSVAVNATFTDRELTALASDHEARWQYYPVSDLQVKINPDGSVETSGILRMDRIYGYAEATGMPTEEMERAIDRIKLPGRSFPFYVKGTLSVVDNKVSGEVQKAEIGRLAIPMSWISGNEEAIAAFVEDRIQAAGLNVKSASFAGGTLKFDGTLPENVQLSPVR